MQEMIHMNIEWSAKANTMMRLAGRTPGDIQLSFPLAPGPHLFTDWRYILSGESWGGFHWVSRETGEIFSVRVRDANGEYTDGPIDAVMAPGDIAYGIRIVTQHATKSAPIDDDDAPGMHILLDGGRLRTWGLSAHSPLYDGVIFCAESDDGFAWRHRQVCTFDWSACPDARTKEPPSVFIDPSATPDERYKMVFYGQAAQPEHGAWRQALLERWLAERPDAIDPNALSFPPDGAPPVIRYARFGAVSADGLHWRVLPEPLLLLLSDCQNVVEYDPARASYVWYLKSIGFGARRCIARAESADFRRWPLPEPMLIPSTEQGPASDWYTSSKTMYPGTTDHHLLFPARYRHATDDTELHLFSSQDGLAWSAVPGGSVLGPGPHGAWDAGFLIAGVNLIPLGGDQVGLPITNSAWPHKFPRNKYTMGSHRLAYAVWPRERLAALEAPERGGFATVPLRFSGRRLRLNMRTKRAGEVRVEVATSGPDGGGEAVLPGRGFDDCRPIVGDELNHIVQWKDGEDLGHVEGQAITLRFRLRAAELFAFEVL